MAISFKDFNKQFNTQVELEEALKGDQHKLDVDKDGKIEGSDLKKLRSKKDEIVVNSGQTVKENEGCGKKMYREFVEEIEQIVEAKVEPSEPNAAAIAKKKAREAAQRRREEKAEADKDDLSKDYKHSSTPKAHTTKVAGKAYGGAAQHDDEEDENDKPNTPAVKRGRGRPAGAKSGARTAGNGKQYGGLTIHSLNLPSKK